MREAVLIAGHFDVIHTDAGILVLPERGTVVEVQAGMAQLEAMETRGGVVHVPFVEAELDIVRLAGKEHD